MDDIRSAMSQNLNQKRFIFFVKSNWFRICFYFVYIIIIAGFVNTIFQIKQFNQNLLATEKNSAAKLDKFYKLIPEYDKLKKLIQDYKAKGVDPSLIENEMAGLKNDLFSLEKYAQVKAKISSLNLQLNNLYLKKQEEARLAEEARILAEQIAKKTGATGKVTSNNSAISGATVSIFSDNNKVVSTQTPIDGVYIINVAAGIYTLTCSKSGYNNFSKSGFVVTKEQFTTLDISLTKYVPPPPKPITSKATTSGNASTAYSTYSRQNISTSKGTFTIDLMTFDLVSGHIKVVTDTANNDDCKSNCPTKSLGSYVSQNGAFAGINGTYFCPSDYASCTGQVNSFLYKVYNTRLGKMINGTNGIWNGEPFLIFDSSGKATYLSQWRQYTNYSFTAGINCAPRLIESGVNVLSSSSMDTKQKTTKSNRGALALKGQTLYAVIAKSATVPDMAAILVKLGVDSALNIDGGGSSAMHYKGSYKVGPGRSLPNAIVFVQQ